MATHSSVMFSKNISEFLMLLVKDGQIRFDFEDEIIRGAMITNEGKVLHEPTRVALEKVGTL
jgi:NAD(P) transhydrogenase subunit alpha